MQRKHFLDDARTGIRPLTNRVIVKKLETVQDKSEESVNLSILSLIEKSR